MSLEMFMAEAVEEAKKALSIDEVPVGCIITKDDKIIAKSYNRRNLESNALSHAEILAIGEACKFLGDWRLEGCRLFVTVEPCPMCAGAIIQARIKTVIYGTRNKKAGCAGSIIDLFSIRSFNHTPHIIEGIMEEECRKLMTDFFAKLRE